MGWVRRALVLCFFGVHAMVLGIVAEDNKPLFGRITTVGGDDGATVMCELPRHSVAMGSLSLLSLLLTVLAGHVAVLCPYTGADKASYQPVEVPTGALFQRTSVTVFFVIAELASALALAMLLWATIGASLRYQPVMEDGFVSCPSATAKTDGMFGGGALIALDAMLMWFVCQLMALEARADYLDLHGGEDDHDDGNSKQRPSHAPSCCRY